MEFPRIGTHPYRFTEPPPGLSESRDVLPIFWEDGFLRYPEERNDPNADADEILVDLYIDKLLHYQQPNL